MTPKIPSTPEPSLAPRKTKIGVLPKYLVDRKMEWAKKEEERLKELDENRYLSFDFFKGKLI